MSTQNKLKPRDANEQFALWLAQNQPQLFAALMKRANTQGQLGGISDWLTNVGTSLSAGVKAVGSYMSSPQGIGTLSTLAGTYLQTQAQKDALRIQLAQARAGYAPQPIVTNATSQQYPMYVDPTTGVAYPLTNQLANQLAPSSGLTQYAPWMIGGGVLLLLFGILRK